VGLQWPFTTCNRILLFRHIDRARDEEPPGRPPGRTNRSRKFVEEAEVTEIARVDKGLPSNSAVWPVPRNKGGNAS
jgi:hypothetical protein